MYRDHFDASMWQENFCKDPMIAENCGPAKNVGLQFCADGVSPYGRKSHLMWFGALSILNLPPAARHAVETMHPCFIVPGPKKPVCPPRTRVILLQKVPQSPGTQYPIAMSRFAQKGDLRPLMCMCSLTSLLSWTSLQTSLSYYTGKELK